MLRLAFDFIITWRETRTRPNAYVNLVGIIHNKQLTLIKIEILASMLLLCIMVLIGVNVRMIQ